MVAGLEKRPRRCTWMVSALVVKKVLDLPFASSSTPR